MGDILAELQEYKPNKCLMKIDVEGSEEDVIIAMSDIIKKIKPVIVCEQKEDLNAVHLLERYGMDIMGRINKDVILKWN